MRRLLRIADAIDRSTDRLGRTVAWLALVMVLIGAFNAIARYAGRFLGLNLSSNAYIELQWYMFSLIFLLAAAWALKRGAHVRVDVFYNRLSIRVQAWIDLIGALALLLPFSVFVLIVSWPSIRNAWGIREVSPDPGGLPRWPLKPLILVCFALLIVQGLAEAIRALARLRGVEPAPAEHAPVEGV